MDQNFPVDTFVIFLELLIATLLPPLAADVMNVEVADPNDVRIELYGGTHVLSIALPKMLLQQVNCTPVPIVVRGLLKYSPHLLKKLEVTLVLKHLVLVPVFHID